MLGHPRQVRDKTIAKGSQSFVTEAMVTNMLSSEPLRLKAITLRRQGAKNRQATFVNLHLSNLHCFTLPAPRGSHLCISVQCLSQVASDGQLVMHLCRGGTSSGLPRALRRGIPVIGFWGLSILAPSGLRFTFPQPNSLWVYIH